MKTEQQTNEQHIPTLGNLIHLEDESKAVKQAKDINNKIDSLETSLDTLQSELDAINHSVDEGLERLSDKDLDLNAKVSETYKRLGEIDVTYKSLSAISANINSEIKKLTFEVNDVAEQSASDLDKLEQTSSSQYSSLSNQHEQLIQRVNGLVTDSRKTNDQLTKSITNNTSALITLEKQLIGDIDTLANTTKQRDNELAINLDIAKQAIDSNKATMLQMQAVDKALALRATALEKSTAELIENSDELYVLTNLLNDRTSSLYVSVKKLKEQSASHASLISTIQTNAKRMSQSLLELGNTEKRHFKILSGILVIALLIIAGLHLYQESTANKVDQNLVNLQQQNIQSVDKLTNVDNEIAILNEKLNKEVLSINKKLQNKDDQLNSLDGRLNHISPFSQLGKDGVIHGSHWLAEQPAENLAIEITSSSDKDELFKIAQRYNYYFKNDLLAYYASKNGKDMRYTLVYGNFSTNSEASSTLQRLPYYIEFKRPAIKTMGEIQKHI